MLAPHPHSVNQEPGARPSFPPEDHPNDVTRGPPQCGRQSPPRLPLMPPSPHALASGKRARGMYPPPRASLPAGTAPAGRSAAAAAPGRESCFPPSGSPNPSLRPLPQNVPSRGTFRGTPRLGNIGFAPILHAEAWSLFYVGARPRPDGFPAVPHAAAYPPCCAVSLKGLARWSASRTARLRRSRPSAFAVELPLVHPQDALIEFVACSGNAPPAGFRDGLPGTPFIQVAVDAFHFLTASPRKLGRAATVPRFNRRDARLH